MVDERNAETLTAYARATLPTTWATWPGGWPGQIEAALLDAVLSIRARYGGPETGVRGAVARWRAHRHLASVDDLSALAGVEPAELAAVLGNQQKLSGGALKAEAAVAAAKAFVNASVRHAADLDPTRPEHRAAYLDVKGLGPVTWRYFCMLLGTEGVKADTWILKFVEAALGRPVAPGEAELLVTRAADTLGASATALDHAIWQHMRSRPGPPA